MDWIAGILTLISTWLMVRKNSYGWVIGLLSQIPWWYIIYEKKMIGVGVLQVGVMIFQISGIIQWGKEAVK